jgi:hypothetical protein
LVPNISLSAGNNNSINLGGVLFARNTYSANYWKSKYWWHKTNGRIGVNVVNPTQTFEVSGIPLYYTGGLTANTISATTYLNLPSSAMVLILEYGGKHIQTTALFYQ